MPKDSTAILQIYESIVIIHLSHPRCYLYYSSEDDTHLPEPLLCLYLKVIAYYRGDLCQDMVCEILFLKSQKHDAGTWMYPVHP